MLFSDLTLVCPECGKEFVFTSQEQDYFEKKGYKRPKFCRECRARHRLLKETVAEPRKMFEVTCSRCGKSTLVPFQTQGSRPVYCYDCFGQVDRRERFEVECSSCGDLTYPPFKPKKDKPFYCRKCLQARRESGQLSAPEIFETVCARCGGPAKVPFKPTGAVYCRTCLDRFGPPDRTARIGDQTGLTTQFAVVRDYVPVEIGFGEAVYDRSSHRHKGRRRSRK